MTAPGSPSAPSTPVRTIVGVPRARPRFTLTHAGRIGTLFRGFALSYDVASLCKEVHPPAGTDFGDFILARGLASGFELISSGISRFYATDNAAAVFNANTPFPMAGPISEGFTARILVSVKAAEPYKHRWPEIFPSQWTQIMHNLRRGNLDTRVVVISAAPLLPIVMNILRTCYAFAVAKNPTLRRALNGGIDDFFVSVRIGRFKVLTLGTEYLGAQGVMFDYGLGVQCLDEPNRVSLAGLFIHELIHKYQLARTSAAERAYAYEVLQRCDTSSVQAEGMTDTGEREAYFMTQILLGLRGSIDGATAEYLLYTYTLFPTPAEFDLKHEIMRLGSRLQ